MKRTATVFLLVTVLLIPLTSCWHHPVQKPSPLKSCITFDSPTFVLGTKYGPPNQSPGDVAFTANRVPVRVEHFVTPSGKPFGFAAIKPPQYGFGSGNILLINNINMSFDFSQLPFAVTTVQLGFVDMGGTENLFVNGSPYQGELTSAPASLGGANVHVTATQVPPPASGKHGTLTLRGNVHDFWIGGQEFAIDNVCLNSF